MLEEFLPRFVEDMRVAHPGTDIDLKALPGEYLAVEASPEFPAALAELVANCVELCSTSSQTQSGDTAEHSSTDRRAETDETLTSASASARVPVVGST